MESTWPSQTNLGSQGQASAEFYGKKENRKTKISKVQVSETVLVKNFVPGPTWLKRVVAIVITPTMFEIQLEDSWVFRRHLDHIWKYTPAVTKKAVG